MQNRRWLDNAFWSDGKNGREITAILEYQVDNKTTTQVMKVPDVLPNGNPNPDYQEIITQVSVGKLDSNTKERLDRHAREQQERTEKEREAAKARELEKLFELKLKAFEIPDIKNSKNRALKSRLRKSKSELELQAYVTMIIMDTIENESATE